VGIRKKQRKNTDNGEVKELFEIGYMTDLMAQRAQHYIALQSAAKPFFMSLHYNAPHWSWETRDDAELALEIKDNLFHIHGGNIHTYRSMVHHMDEGIGHDERCVGGVERHHARDCARCGGELGIQRGGYAAAMSCVWLVTKK
jgi:Sulfatase